MRFTKELRQKIVEEFARENGGWFDPVAFLAAVQKKGPEHPAYEWFEWDNAKAADEHRRWQARTFAKDLVVRFEVHTQERGKVKVVQQTSPLLLSPGDKRSEGGGYFLMDPDNPEHMEELCRQAAKSLEWFLRRYEAAIVFSGGRVKSLQTLELQLRAVYEAKEDAA